MRRSCLRLGRCWIVVLDDGKESRKRRGQRWTRELRKTVLYNAPHMAFNDRCMLATCMNNAFFYFSKLSGHASQYQKVRCTRPVLTRQRTTNVHRENSMHRTWVVLDLALDSSVTGQCRLHIFGFCWRGIEGHRIDMTAKGRGT